MGQVAVAVVVGLAVVLLAGGVTRSTNSLLAWVLVVLALAQLPVIMFSTQRLGTLQPGAGARRAALQGALVTGVLLASTAWFLSLALATGQNGAPLFLLLSLTLLAYGVGFILTGRLGRLAASEVFEEPDGGEDGTQGPGVREADEPGSGTSGSDEPGSAPD